MEMQKQAAEVLYKKGVLKNFAKFSGKYLHWSRFFLIKLQAPSFTEHLWITAFAIRLDLFILNILYIKYNVMC